MAIFQALLLLFFGIGLLLVDYQSLSSGWLPAGSKLGSRTGRFEVYRAERPLFYWVMFAVYAGFGATLIVYAVRILTGNMEPLPLS